MEALIDFLNIYLGNDVAVRRVVVVVIAGTIFLLGLGIVVLIMGATNPVRRRLGLIAPEEEEQRGTIALKVSTLVGPVASYVLPRGDAERNKVLDNLQKAGFRSPQALQVFYALKTVSAILFPVSVLIASRFMPELETQKVMYYAMMAAGVGIILPSYILDKLVERRIKQLRNAFPDALDMLVVCVESGLGLGPALQRVADELAVAHPELSFELATVTAEMRASVTREKALKNLADRTGLADIRGLVGLLVQSLKFGTSVADALRVYAEEFRDRRMQAAEERAAKLATKMIFPLIFCMFPVFFIVAVGPAVLKMADAFRSMGS